eukprot:gnl/TRDRNA2_/TRDRNA2_183321_c0_seq1.p2 gnl/TRDRNA2_/TRDRNA2_183321_c0~~gnl/TRDRNA2_/TRDRNA2_183321_c0_seq1.p2  ORF type:complete len:106 (+),score=12.08 gnl/TRDRNA2_/TRDRNA2_183321_c0_seq1:179-496(+)
MTVFIILDVLKAIFGPPLLYVWVALALIGVLIYVLPESVWYGILDCWAQVMRGFAAFCNGILWCLQRCCFPCKEMAIEFMDSWSYALYPYMKKTPNRPGIPRFVY